MLDAHDRSRVFVQKELDGVCAKMLGEVDMAEERVSAELGKSYEREEARLQEEIHKRSNDNNTGNSKGECYGRKYAVVKNDDKRDIHKKVILKFEKTENAKGENAASIETLQSLSDQHSESKASAAEAIVVVCNGLREEVKCLKERINSELEGQYTAEDKRLQDLLSGEFDEETTRAKALIGQSYSLLEDKNAKGISTRYSLATKRGALGLRMMKLRGVSVKEIKGGKIYLNLSLFSEKEREVLESFGFLKEIAVMSRLYEEGGKKSEYKVNMGDKSIEPDVLRAKTTYTIQLRVEHKGEMSSFSDPVVFTTPDYNSLCAWKECPNNVNSFMRYHLDEVDPKIATTAGNEDCRCVLVGNTPLPLGVLISWSIKIRKTRDNVGGRDFVGVAPFDIEQNPKYNYREHGWFFDCFDSTLWSGPPHKYRCKIYGPRKGLGKYVRTGSEVRVLMDMATGDLSYVINEVSLGGVAYEGIPLDKPLAPCVLLGYGGDSVELNAPEGKEFDKDDGCIIS